jgi:hypothetical protein
LLVEEAEAGVVEVGDLPEVEDAGVVEAQFQLAVDAGNALRSSALSACRLQFADQCAGGNRQTGSELADHG